MATERVFRMRVNSIEGSPRIDTQLPENSNEKIPWGRIGSILRGTSSRAEYKAVQLRVYELGWENWHYYPLAGTFGLFSERLVELIGPYMKCCFEPYLTAFVNQRKYYFVRQFGSFDCLDLEHSDVIPFPHDSQRIMRVVRFCFFKEKIPDPFVFVVPETSTDVLATQSIKDIVEHSHLNGLAFIDAEAIG